jgi:hypothetical protein
VRFAERQGVVGIGNHSARDGYNDAGGIAPDGTRMIWTWKLHLSHLHFGFPVCVRAQTLGNCVTCSTKNSGTGVVDGYVEATETSDGLVNEVLDFLFMPHIGAHKLRLSAELA